MSPARPASWRTVENRYRRTSIDLARKAAQERYRKPLELCLREIEQFHSTAFPTCTGGCPACEAIEAARSALKLVV